MAEAISVLGVFGITLWALFGDEHWGSPSKKTSTLFMEPLDDLPPRSLMGYPPTRIERTVI